jgi:hypothetical protein
LWLVGEEEGVKGAGGRNSGMTVELNVYTLKCANETNQAGHTNTRAQHKPLNSSGAFRVLQLRVGQTA